MPGSLREQLLPVDHEKDVPDKHFLAVLHRLECEQLLERVGGLDAKEDWCNVLSVSEQRLLTIAPARSGRPGVCLPRRGHKRLRRPAREHLYAILAETGITYVSAGNEPELREYHDLLLELDAHGGWHLQALGHLANACDHLPEPTTRSTARDLSFSSGVSKGDR